VEEAKHGRAAVLDLHDLVAAHYGRRCQVASVAYGSWDGRLREAQLDPFSVKVCSTIQKYTTRTCKTLATGSI